MGTGSPALGSVCFGICFAMGVFLGEEKVFSEKSLYGESLSRRYITYLQHPAVTQPLK